MKLPKHIENWDDERDLDHGIIVTLRYGWSFEPNEHQGVRSFETISEAKEESARKNIYKCSCDTCKEYLEKENNK